jgi:hypothetical protein
MDKIYLSNHIKLEILNICGLPSARSYNLAGTTPLYTLGFENKQHCRQLEEKLQAMSIDYNTGRSIGAGVISKELTVSQCIQLIIT